MINETTGSSGCNPQLSPGRRHRKRERSGRQAACTLVRRSSGHAMAKPLDKTRNTTHLSSQSRLRMVPTQLVSKAILHQRWPRVVSGPLPLRAREPEHKAASLNAPVRVPGLDHHDSSCGKAGSNLNVFCHFPSRAPEFCCGGVDGGRLPKARNRGIDDTPGHVSTNS